MTHKPEFDLDPPRRTRAEVLRRLSDDAAFQRLWSSVRGLVRIKCDDDLAVLLDEHEHRVRADERAKSAGAA